MNNYWLYSKSNQGCDCIISLILVFEHYCKFKLKSVAPFITSIVQSLSEYFTL